MIIGLSGKKQSGKDTVASIIEYITDQYKQHGQILDEFDYWVIQAVYNRNNYQPHYNKKQFAYKLKQIVCILIGCTMEQLENNHFKEKELGEEWDKWLLSWKNSDDGPGFKYFNTKEELIQFVNENYEDNFEDLNSDLISFIKMTPRLLLQLLGTDFGRKMVHPNIWVNSLMSDIDKELGYKVVIQSNSVSVFEKLQLIEKLPDYKAKYKCYCGNEFITNIYKVKSGHTKSCGCYQKARATETQYKDGRKGTKLWTMYNNMIQRCENPNQDRYEDYGGRGITVSNSFKPFENFKLWAENNGYSEELTLDREDVNDIYCPDNCRFVSNSIQATNTRNRIDNTSGFRGVSKDKHGWKATIQVNKVRKFLGYFNTPEKASLVYEQAFIERQKLYLKQQIKIQKGFIITDVRFPEEVKAIEDRGGIILRIDRPIEYYMCDECMTEDILPYELKEENTCPRCGCTDESNLTMVVPIPDAHESEIALDDYPFKHRIVNDGSIEDLILKVKQILEDLKII